LGNFHTAVLVKGTERFRMLALLPSSGENMKGTISEQIKCTKRKNDEESRASLKNAVLSIKHISIK
jgi:hypothetical protein